jgi:hypothetical protein
MKECKTIENMTGEDIVNLSFVAFLFLIIFIGAFIMIKKRWINTKCKMYTAQFTAQNVYLQYQNLQKKKSIEHVIDQNDEKKQDDDGDDIKRFCIS